MNRVVGILLFGASALGAPALGASAPAVSVTNTTVEYVARPLALDLDYNPSPRFAWVAVDGTGGAQTSYNIKVVDAAGATVWDSGDVQSAASTQVEYNSSNPLSPDADYTWTVCVSTASGSSGCSAAAAFASAPSAAAWAASAVFIGGYPQMRTNFSLPAAPVTRARLYASGVGVFEAWVNGVRVGSPNGIGAGASVLAPGWSTVAPVRVLAHAYDVSALLTPGAENVIGVRTGMGKYGYLGVYCTGGEAACNAAALRLVVSQCTAPSACINSTIETDSTHWLGSDSPITFVSL